MQYVTIKTVIKQIANYTSPAFYPHQLQQPSPFRLPFSLHVLYNPEALHRN